MLTSLCHTEHINHIAYFHTFTYTFHVQILYIKIIFQKIPYDTLNILTHPKNKKRNLYYIYIIQYIFYLRIKIFKSEKKYSVPNKLQNYSKIAITIIKYTYTFITTYFKQKI